MAGSILQMGPEETRDFARGMLIRASGRTVFWDSFRRPRTAALAGVEALTPSELRVATLAADGKSNREIAQALFVTPKTVEVHLSHAYRKLGIRSRRELAAELPTT
jgi:DNA-binding NarL/FixJ family response regulator